MNKFDYLSLSTQQLLVFVTLHEVGTVTATAERLQTTQSAVSHSLQKLREVFADELFVRAGRSVMPTQRSQQLYPEIKSVLEKLQTLTHTQHFEPAKATLAYTIFANDFQRDIILPALYKHIAPQVAGLSLEVQASGKPTSEQLRSQAVDLVFSPIAPDHSDIMAVRVFDDVSACFYDPSKRQAPTSKHDYAQAKFVGLSYVKGISVNNTPDTFANSIDANTVIRVNSFSAIAEFVQGTQLLTVAPSRLQSSHFKQLANTVLPYASSITMYMLWHKRYQNDVQHQWLREQVMAVTAGLRA